MEKKLMEAAKNLPQPECTFIEMEEKVRQNSRRAPKRPMKRLIPLALMLCLLITACAYSSTKYGLWGGYSSTSISDARGAAEKFGFQLPETLNGSPFQTYSTAHGAPEGANYLQAMLSPTYKLYTVRYAVEKREVREDGEYGWEENVVSVSFGTTEKEQWKYHFSVAEDGSCNYSRVEPGSNRTAEYQGYTLYLYTIGTSHSVRWEDAQRKIVIDMSCYDLEKQEDAVGIAKELIDLNLPETEENETA